MLISLALSPTLSLVQCQPSWEGSEGLGASSHSFVNSESIHSLPSTPLSVESYTYIVPFPVYFCSFHTEHPPKAETLRVLFAVVDLVRRS